MADQPVRRIIAGGKYEIVRPLGEGGMGTVYEARQVTMDRMVALKLILPGAQASKDAAARFEREMKLTARIEHPNTIRVYDFGETDGQLFLTMELVRGRTLTKVIAEARRLELSRIVRIATQITRALGAAHTEGVVHRDLKPDNVMLIEQYGEHDVVKVLDFGIAKSLDERVPGVTQTGAVVGTPAYMSAEQAMGQSADPRSDLYSLGVMLYEMACGQLPFTAPGFTGMLLAHAHQPPPPLAQIAPDVHPGLAALVEQLLAKEPELRPQTARAVEQRLEPLVTGPAVSDALPVQRLGELRETSPRALASTQPLKPVGPDPLATPPMRPVPRGTVQPNLSADAMAHTQPMAPVPATHPIYRNEPQQIVQPLPPIQPTYPVYGQPTPPAHAHPTPQPAPSIDLRQTQPPHGRRILWLTLVAVIIAGGGGAAIVFATRQPTTSQPVAGQPRPPEPMVDDKGRLAAARAKLASFDDPPPPDNCPTAAAADAAELILTARQALANDPTNALAAATAATAKCAGAAAAFNVRGNALQKLARLTEAGDAYERALALAPDYLAPRSNLGILQLRRHDAGAIATFTEVIRRRSDDADAYKLRAQAYVDAHRYAEAVADLEAGLGRRGDDGHAWLLLGQLRDKLKQGDANDAYCKAAALKLSEADALCRR